MSQGILADQEGVLPTCQTASIQYRIALDPKCKFTSVTNIIPTVIPDGKPLILQQNIIRRRFDFRSKTNPNRPIFELSNNSYHPPSPNSTSHVGNALIRIAMGGAGSGWYWIVRRKISSICETPYPHILPPANSNL